MQKKMSSNTQSRVLVLKVNGSAEEDEYRYSRLVEVQRNMSTDTQSLIPILKVNRSAEEDEYRY